MGCLISRVALECRLAGASPGKTESICSSCRDLLARIRDNPVPHPVTASQVHRHAYAMLGVADPYRELKEESTRQALRVCREERENLRTFRDLVLAAVIGNTFDYGVKAHEVTEDFAGFFREEFTAGLTIDDTEKIEPLCHRVVYFTDNCGEIVFDRLLLEYLSQKGAAVTLATRDLPILNDATIEDIESLHIERFVDTVTTTGCGCEIGVRKDCMPADLAEAFASATLIISKGMANYESLTELSDLPPVAYLMAVKCEPIAEDVGVPRGSKIALLCEPT